MLSDVEMGSSESDAEDLTTPNAPTLTPWPWGYAPPPYYFPPLPGQQYYLPPMNPSPSVQSGSLALTPAASGRHPPSRETLAIAFAETLFDDIVTERPAGRRGRSIFQWPKADISTEDRLLVGLRALRKAGFPTIGSFMGALLGARYNKHKAVYQSIASFVQSKENDPNHHPAHIIGLIYRHQHAQVHVNRIPQIPSFSLPRHSLAPSGRLLPSLPQPTDQSTKNVLLNWALHVVLEHIDKEAAVLLQPSLGFCKLDTVTWDSVLSWSLSDSQELVALHAPATFAVLTTFAVNARARGKLKKSVLATTESSATNGPFEPIREAESSLEPNSLDESENDMELEEESDALNTDGTDDTQSSGEGAIGRRDPWQAVTVVILLLLYHRYRFALLFPMIVGTFLFTCNAHKDIIAILSRIGLSVSYQTVLNTLHLLAADSSTQLKVWGAFSDVAGPKFLLLFDNVNKQKRAWQAVIGQKDEVKSGTAATLIALEDVPPGALRIEPVLEKIQSKARGSLTVKELQRDIDWTHIEGIGAGTVLRVLLKYVPTLSAHKSAVEDIFAKDHSKHPLRLRKSHIHPMRTTSIDESSTGGVGEVVLNLTIDQLAVLPLRLFKWFIMFCGDQLSIDRMRKLIRYSHKTDTPFDRRQWVLPVIQLWHLKWNWQKCIFRLHWHSDLTKGVYGLHYDCASLSRKFNPTKCDFYPAHHILEDRFDALILEAIRILCEEKTHKSFPADKFLINTVQEYFQVGGALHDVSFDTLKEMAGTVYQRYMCTAASEDALGAAPRDPTVYGPDWEIPRTSIPTTENRDNQSIPLAAEARTTAMTENTDVDSEDTGGFTGDAHHHAAGDSIADGQSTSSLPSQNPAKRTRTKVAAQPRRNFLDESDQDLITTINFMRMTFWYMELCAATAEGDIGRVFEVVKLLRFSFWGAGSTNYGNELLELACNFLYEFSDDLKSAIFNNYLVNVSGLKGHWFELDLLQEHFNFWIKRLFNSKSHDFDAKHLSEAVSLNIHGIQSLRERFRKLFGLAPISYSHTNASTIHDINALGIHYRKHHMLRFVKGRSQTYSVENEYSSGVHILTDGKLDAFLTRTLRDGSVHLTEEESTSEELPDTPANPVTSNNGVTNVAEFVTGE